MKIIKHKFHNHLINPETQILIIGTFNPDTENNPAEFFYGRSRNFLWRLLPTAFNFNDLKGKSKADKLDFISKEKIDFVDLITSVAIEEGNETNYNDAYIDSRVLEWRDILAELKRLKKLKKVCFTRKSFSDIPEMKKKIEEVKDYCDNNGIPFEYLTTPARFYREDKQQEWTTFFSV
jgi:G:T/U-mismatch repair DNA glycosylase